MVVAEWYNRKKKKKKRKKKRRKKKKKAKKKGRRKEKKISVNLNSGVIPPLLEVAILVELTSLVVEAVRNFMTDDDADAAVVERLGELAAVEERLEDSGREHYVVLVGVVESVDDGRLRRPLIFGHLPEIGHEWITI